MKHRVLIYLGIAMVGLLSGSAQATTFTVTRTDDPVADACEASDCSLREAVIAANATGGPDLILLPPTDYGLTLAGTGAAELGDLDIEGIVTIRGSGPAQSIIQANQLMRLFDVPAGAALHLENLKLLNGKPGAGEGGNGGCVNAQDAIVTVFSSTFDGCVGANGGAIAASNTDLTLVDSSIANSEANFGGAASVYVNGGAAPRQFHASNVFFVYNQADQDGGALYLSGASLHSTMLGVLVVGNTTGPSGSGGGIHITSGGGGGGRLVLDLVRVTNNHAADGAGLYIADAAVEARRVSLIDNVADAQGGAAKIFSADGSLRFEESAAHGNSAGSTGGAFKLNFGRLDVRNATVTGNIASSGNALYAESGGTATFNHATLVEADPDMVRISGTGTSVTWSNSIVNGGCSSFAGGSQYTSLGGNLESPGDSCGLDHGSDLVNRTPLQLGLGPFEPHGGPTDNYSIGASSQARDQGLTSSCPPIDQRLGVRPDGPCDAGSHEYAAVANDYLFGGGFDG